jgi:hypothetical protein
VLVRNANKQAFGMPEIIGVREIQKIAITKILLFCSIQTLTKSYLIQREDKV